jgi:hypothetical protein
MSFRKLLRAATVLLALAGAPAMAQTCVGFVDVPAASALCPSVEWLKNRGITTGCAIANSYCPNDNVTRLSMAAFLARTGDKLTPVVIEPVPSVDSITQLNLTTPQVVCPTGDYTIPVGSFPRRAKFFGRVNLYNPSANGDFISEMAYTVTDIGQPASTTWLAVQNTAAYQTLYAGMAPAHDVSTYPQGYLDLAVGKIYRFGMRVSRYTGTTANVAAFCVNLVEIGNRTSPTAPFDAMYSPLPDQPPAEGRALPRS